MAERRTFDAVLVGEEPLLVECAKILLSRGHRIRAVVADDPGIRAWAREAGLTSLGHTPDLPDHLPPGGFDYLFSIANLRILPQRVLDLAARGAVNYHDALLPRHAGVFATSWALLAGEREHGVTWHLMTDVADAGDILGQASVPVEPDDTAHTLNVKCHDAGRTSFATLVDRLADGTAIAEPQDLSLRTYHARLDGPPDGGLIDPRGPADAVSALVRATTFGGHPNRFGAALLAADDRFFTVEDCEVLPGAPSGEPGTVLRTEGGRVTLATATHDVRLSVTPLAGTDVPNLPARLDPPDLRVVEAWVRVARTLRRHERHWAGRLADLQPPDVPWRALAEAAAGPARTPAVRDTPPVAGAALPFLLAAFGSFLGRVSAESVLDLAVHTEPMLDGATPPRGLLVGAVPLRVLEPAAGRSMLDLAAEVAADLDRAGGTRTHVADLWRREPSLRQHPRQPVASLPVRVDLVAGPLTAVDLAPADSGVLTLRATRDGTAWTLLPGPGTDPAVAAWMDERFTGYLAAAAEDPTGEAARLPILSPDELRRTATQRSATTDYPRDECVHQLVLRQAGRTPHAPAVRFAGRELTYADIDRESGALARRLRALGVGPGSLVGVFQHRGERLPVTLLAVLRTGAGYVPLDPVYPPERISYMLRDARVGVVVADQDLAAGLPAVDATVLVPDAAVPGHDPEPSHAPEPSPDQEHGDPLARAYVIYTSGSTGAPKGVQVGHRALTNFLCSMATRPGFTADDRLLAVTTICFDIAGLELFLPLVTGGCVELATADEAADAAALLARMAAARPSVMQATPATWQMLVSAGWQGDPGLTVLCGGEALPPDLADALTSRAAAVWNLYGPTETTIWSCVERVRPGQPVTIGHPIANTRCYVLDGRGQPLPDGVDGELCIAGDGVADGYLGRPELTAERFPDDPFGPGRMYRTGDLVRRLPDGRLRYLRRLDSQVKLHGFRIELGEIEVVLRRHPQVREAVALVREDAPGERRLVGYLLPEGNPSGDLVEQVRGHLRQHLPQYMVPTQWVVLDAVPQTPNGKVDRKALPAPGTRTVPGPPPATELERRIAEAWCEVLRVQRVAVDLPFFDAGGDSLRLTEVLARLRERLDPQLSRIDMYRYPTVRAMARHLGGRETAPLAEERGRNGRAALAARRRRVAQP
ncbi:amino acid adenylation domain-containing protein [Dactylosporangium sp. NPDC051484]|uniref:amino acid adenylation domain-containing protein n=1 Tax=Dactylosporangium sp. NPDC051484 TaxID=3154942 RepID=UPI00344CA749